jgi:hypothetical protein
MIKQFPEFRDHVRDPERLRAVLALIIILSALQIDSRFEPDDVPSEIAAFQNRSWHAQVSFPSSSQRDPRFACTMKTRSAGYDDVRGDTRTLVERINNQRPLVKARCSRP